MTTEEQIVPHGTGRNAKLAKLDAWLLLNTERLVNESPKSIALELRALGHFSKATGLGDIRLSFQRRCKKLGLPYSRASKGPGFAQGGEGPG